MNYVLKTTLLGLFFGTFGTTLGGILGSLFEIKSNRKLSFILEFAAGLMLAIICFELIPEALQISDISSSLIGILIGVGAMIICDSKIKSMSRYKNSKSSDLLRTGIVVGIGLAVHNLPEGLAIGSGFDASTKLGFSLAIAIALHDIPDSRFQSRHQVKNA